MPVVREDSESEEDVPLSKLIVAPKPASGGPAAAPPIPAGSKPAPAGAALPAQGANGAAAAVKPAAAAASAPTGAKGPAMPALGKPMPAAPGAPASRPLIPPPRPASSMGAKAGGQAKPAAPPLKRPRPPGEAASGSVVKPTPSALGAAKPADAAAAAHKRAGAEAGAGAPAGKVPKAAPAKPAGAGGAAAPGVKPAAGKRPPPKPAAKASIVDDDESDGEEGSSSSSDGSSGDDDSESESEAESSEEDEPIGKKVAQARSDKAKAAPKPKSAAASRKRPAAASPAKRQRSTKAADGADDEGGENIVEGDEPYAPGATPCALRSRGRARCARGWRGRRRRASSARGQRAGAGRARASGGRTRGPCASQGGSRGPPRLARSARLFPRPPPVTRVAEQQLPHRRALVLSAVDLAAMGVESRRPTRRPTRAAALVCARTRGAARPPRPSPLPASLLPRASPSRARAGPPFPLLRRWFQDKDDVNWKKGAVKWRTLQHAGVLFPPAYERHNAPFRYAGAPVPLSAEQEECATWYAAMMETDFGKDPKFQENFFDDWKKLLLKSAEGRAVKDFAKCDFSQIAAHVRREDAKRKERSREDKEAERAAKQLQEAPFLCATVDGRKEKVGNFRVEPPGLFRGRGDHPKRGRVKKRIVPEDITINLGKGVPVPPVPDLADGKAHKWGAVVSDSRVTWLAKWRDSINGQDKCVWLAANSAWKGMSDMAKYNKARSLKGHIERVRSDYAKGMGSGALKLQQRSVAVYLIDQLALRVGNEKNTDEEADTVGCCSLRVEHVTLHEGSRMELHFLGKDSIEFHQTVEVLPQVHKLLQAFKHKKRADDELFDQIKPQDLNDYFREIMDGLTAKASAETRKRCARASPRAAPRAAARLTRRPCRRRSARRTGLPHVQRVGDARPAAEQDGRARGRRADCEGGPRDRAFQLLLGGQQGGGRAVQPPAGRSQKLRRAGAARHLRGAAHLAPRALTLARAPPARPATLQMARVQERIDKVKEELSAAKKGGNAARIEAKARQLEKMEADKRTKVELKNVALGTSRINYNDPRITVAWCKAHDMPITKPFNKSLLSKFTWAMSSGPEWRF